MNNLVHWVLLSEETWFSFQNGLLEKDDVLRPSTVATSGLMSICFSPLALASRTLTCFGRGGRIIIALTSTVILLLGWQLV